MNKKVLITGASGHLGGMLFNSLAMIGYTNLIGTDLKRKNIRKNQKFILADLKNFGKKYKYLLEAKNFLIIFLIK